MDNTNVLSTIMARRPRLRPLIYRVSVRFGGDKPKELERFIKFAIVGVIGTVVDLGLFNIMLKFVFHVTRENTQVVLLASTISFTIAVISNFIFNRYWTYPDSRSHPLLAQLGQFFAVNIVGLLIRSLIVGVLVTPIIALIGTLPDSLMHSLGIAADFEAQLGSDVAILAATAVVLLWNFFANRYWTYNDVK
ncbi:MAG: GtrA family protein [Chloroflexota bacterium]